MEYSVYIIQDRTKTNKDIFKALASDTGVGEHLKNLGAGAANNLAGGEIFDQYATDDKLGKNGIAINGEMIKSVSIKPALVKKETFDKGTTQVNWSLMTTITVKGSLFAPSMLEMKSKTIRNKNMAKVLAWASLPKTYASCSGEGYKGPVPTTDNKGIVLNSEIQFGYDQNADIDTPNSYESQYYRRVLVTVYSDKDTQFRAILHDKVYVDSYEEEYSDKDGNGKFTLVMKCVGTNIFDTFIAGPTYKWTPLSVADQITSAAKQHKKTVDKVVESVDRVAGTNIAETIAPYKKKTDSVFDTADSIKGDITIDNLADNVDKQAETWHPTDMQNAIDQASEYQKTYSSLTDEQKNTLKNISGFDKLSMKEKMDYIEKLKETMPKAPVSPPDIQGAIDAANKYRAVYDALSDEQKETLKNVPGFDGMSPKEKMDYIDGLFEHAYKSFIDEQKKTMKGLPGSDILDINKKIEHIKNLKDDND